MELKEWDWKMKIQRKREWNWKLKTLLRDGWNKKYDWDWDKLKK
jgi:hypothetical protein